MKHFLKLPSLVQIIFFEMLTCLMVTPLLAALAYWLFHPASVTVQTRFGWGDVVWFAIGVASLAWLLRSIFRPRIGRVSWVPVLGAGGVPVWNPAWSVETIMPSTHPSYVLVDAFAGAFAGVISYLWIAQFDDMWLLAWTLIGVGALIPVLRLVAWYALGLKPGAEFTDPRSQRQAAAIRAEAWKPVAHLYGWFVLPLVSVFAIFWLKEERDDARAYAALPVLTEADFAKPGFLTPLLDRANQFERKSQRVRLGLPMKSAVMKCQGERNKNRFAYVSVVLSAGPAGDVFVAGVREQGEAIEKLAAGRAGQRLEIVGRLGEMPATLPDWKWYCDLDKVAPRPRWFLDVEGYPWAPARRLMAR